MAKSLYTKHSEFVPDYSLQNVQAANDISYLHPVNYPLRLKPKCNKRN